MIVDTLNEMRIAALKSGDKQVENHASYFLSVAKKVIKDGGGRPQVMRAMKLRKQHLHLRLLLFLSSFLR